MALDIFQALVKNDGKILDYFQNAKNIWEEIFSGLDWENIEVFAQTLTDMQLKFEYQCGFRTPGQEVMVVSGFAILYDIHAGFGDNEYKAQAMYQAYQRSMCSMEIKFEAEKIARLYNLIED